MRELNKNAALLIVDVQKAIDDPYWGIRNNSNMESVINDLLTFWRERGMTVIFIRHNSTSGNSAYRPGQIGNEFKDELKPDKDELVINKNVTSAFIGTALETELRNRSISEVVVTGVITNNSVEATVRVGSNLGFEMITVSDGTSTFGRHGWRDRFFTADEVHSLSLSNIDGEYGVVLTAEEVKQKYA